MEKKPCGIYVHIPFCVRKCRYCDFLSAPGDSKCIREYVSVLKKEIASYSDKARAYSVKTLYFGGGTPSILSADRIGEITEAIGGTFDLKDITEFTIEVNPGTVTFDKLSGYKKAGADRLSVGIQSAHDDELKLLGRIHTFNDAKETFRMAREAGFDNISADVISALPGQTLEAYSDTLDSIIGLKPRHISSYSLIIEEGTPFYYDYGEKGAKKNELPDEETDRRMYSLTEDKLAQAGYRRYEISNYAVPGFESRHNSAYWTGREYFGLGLGASSFVENVRYSNIRDMGEYLKRPDKRVIEEVLDKKALMAEFMILGLRMTEGISKKSFEDRFGLSLDSVYGEIIRRFERENALTEEGDSVRLTGYGLDVSNTVFAEFL